MIWRDFWFGVLWVTVSFTSFFLLRFLVRWYLFKQVTFPTFSYSHWRERLTKKGQNKHLPPSQEEVEERTNSTSLSVVPPNKKWRICNEVISLIHLAISGAWALYALITFQQLIEDMVNYRCKFVENLLFLSTGYILHDFVDLVVNERSARIIELLFRHAAVLLAFGTTIVTQCLLGVVLFGLLMELNSIFLHARSLLNLYGVQKQSAPFRIVALLNVVSLLLFRIAVSVYLLYWLMFHVWNMSVLVAISSIVVIASLATVNFTLE